LILCKFTFNAPTFPREMNSTLACEQEAGWSSPAGMMALITCLTALGHAAGFLVLKRSTILDSCRPQQAKKAPTSKIRRDIAEVTTKVQALGQFLTEIQARLPSSSTSGSTQDSPDRIV
jgi:hypothetical protein